MFVRVMVVLERVQDATIVPEQALVKREEQSGVFLVSEDGASGRWRRYRSASARAAGCRSTARDSDRTAW